MKKLLILIVAIWCGVEGAHSAMIADLDSLMSSEEMATLTKRLEEIQNNHQHHFFIYLFSDPSQKPAKTSLEGQSALVYVYVNRAEQSVTVETSRVAQSYERLFEQLFLQFFLVPVKAGAPEVASLNAVFNEIDQEFMLIKEERRQALLEEEQANRMDPKAKVLLWLFFTIFVIFLTVFILKSTRSGNKYEAIEFYGLSRLPSWLNKLMALVILIGGIAWIFQTITNGAWGVVFAYLLVVYPILVFVVWMIKALQDALLWSKYDQEEVALTLGQKLWLIRPHTSTEYLLELTFYDQIIRKRIALDIEKVEENHREVTHFFVSPGSAFHPETKFTLDEKVFIYELYTEQENLRPFLHRVYEKLDRFRAYRKNAVLKGLFLSGLLVKYGWPFNYFELSAKGKAWRQKLSEEQAAQSALIMQGTDDPTTIVEILPKLTPHVLLIENFEERITAFYNEMVEIGLLIHAMSLPIGFLFHPDFSLRTFNQKVMDAYDYSFILEDLISNATDE